tara:strand:+ start:665 stop:796 length:132 start_codon:yes stop_codon:yes gene_type:complete
MEGLVDGVAQVGITIFCIVVAMLIVNWLDRNVFSNHKNFKDEE